ncbi:unnamed protein product [Microthlaspi erraticum]|uniref:Uncharacterized protein n=1 Tax=Microthlaspi erraticum TaxID=1685480 RepID=A0A6D2JHZ8_9BRAS|nr:unnamed protein product [Microthlaspi erraticum]
MKLGFKRASGRPRRWDGRRDDRPDNRVVAESERSGRMDSRSAGVVGGRDLADVSRPDVGRYFPARTDASAVVRGTGCAAARLVPGSRAWSCAAWRDVWLGRPRDNVSRVVLRDRPVLNFGRDFRRTDMIWPSAKHSFSASRTARLGAVLDRAVWTVFTLLVVTPFLLIQIRPFQLRWKVNSIRARRELVLMKSIE